MTRMTRSPTRSPSPMISRMRVTARKLARILMDLCESDLRCLDAHAHLGNFVFDIFPERALRHYEVGVRIGEWSLGDRFDGLLPWGHIDNRPFLRCMHGYGLCLWRLGRFDEAGRRFRPDALAQPLRQSGSQRADRECEGRKGLGSGPKQRVSHQSSIPGGRQQCQSPEISRIAQGTGVDNHNMDRPRGFSW